MSTETAEAPHKPLTDAEFRALVLSITLDPMDLSYTAANVRFSCGNLPKALRREAVVAARTLRDVILAARGEAF